MIDGSQRSRKSLSDPRRAHAGEVRWRAASAKARGVRDSCSPLRRQPPSVCYRQAGDKYLLVEYGPLVLDLELRFRVHALMEWLQRAQCPGVLELTPGIRSLQVHYDSRAAVAERDLLEVLQPR